MTTAAIAREAKVSKRAIYELFDTKEALLAAVIRRSIGGMTEVLRLSPPQDRAGFYEALRAFGATFLSFILHKERIALYRMAISEAGHGTGTLGSTLMAEGLGGVVQQVEAFFAAAEERGLLSRMGAIPLSGVFLAVLIGSSQMRLLLGAVDSVTDAVVQERSDRAVALVRRLIEG